MFNNYSNYSILENYKGGGGGGSSSAAIKSEGNQQGNQEGNDERNQEINTNMKIYLNENYTNLKTSKEYIVFITYNTIYRSIEYKFTEKEFQEHINNNKIMYYYNGQIYKLNNNNLEEFNKDTEEVTEITEKISLKENLKEDLKNLLIKLDRCLISDEKILIFWDRNLDNGKYIYKIDIDKLENQKEKNYNNDCENLNECHNKNKIRNNNLHEDSECVLINADIHTGEIGYEYRYPNDIFKKKDDAKEHFKKKYNNIIISHTFALLLLIGFTVLIILISLDNVSSPLWLMGLFIFPYIIFIGICVSLACFEHIYILKNFNEEWNKDWYSITKQDLKDDLEGKNKSLFKQNHLFKSINADKKNSGNVPLGWLIHTCCLIFLPPIFILLGQWYYEINKTKT